MRARRADYRASPYGNTKTSKQAPWVLQACLKQGTKISVDNVLCRIRTPCSTGAEPMSCRREGLVCLRKGSGGGVKVPWLHDRRSRVNWEGRLMQTVSVCPPIRVSLGGLNCIERWMIIPRSEATQALHEPVRRKSLAAWRRPGSGGVRGTNSRRTLGPSTAIANLTQHGASDRSMPYHRCLRSYNVARHCVSRRRHVRDRCE